MPDLPPSPAAEAAVPVEPPPEPTVRPDPPPPVVAPAVPAPAPAPPAATSPAPPPDVPLAAPPAPPPPVEPEPLARPRPRPRPPGCPRSRIFRRRSKRCRWPTPARRERHVSWNCPGSSPSPTRRVAWGRPPPPSTWVRRWRKSGLRVLVVDLDPQGNASTGLGINPRDVSASIYDVLMHDTPALDAVEPTSLKNLFVIPATLDLAGAEIELVPAFSRELKLKRALEAVRDGVRRRAHRLPTFARPADRERPGRGRRRDRADPVRVLRPRGSGPAPAERGARPLEPQRLARRARDHPHHVRRPDPAGRAGRDRGAGALRRQGLQDRRSPDGAPGRGAVVRPAGDRVRLDVARRHRHIGIWRKR